MRYNFTYSIACNNNRTNRNIKKNDNNTSNLLIKEKILYRHDIGNTTDER